MRIEVERKDDVPVIRLGGKVIGDAVPQFESSLREQLKGDTRKMVLDLGDVQLLDSTGLGVLVACYTTLRKRAGSVALVRVPDQVREVLQMTKLETLFRFYEDEEEALRDLEG